MGIGPIDASDPLQVADWIELEALLQPDGDSGIGDAERYVKRGGAPGEDEDVAALLSDSLTELNSRARAAADAYPFRIVGGSVSLRANWADFTPYTFCLVLSFLGYRFGEATQPMARLFEEVSESAARGYLSGDAIRFGVPRTATKAGFRGLLQEFQQQFDEGKNIREWEVLSPQDDHLDIVAWRHHPDRQMGKMLLFGQCASGEKWKQKLTELRPDSFVNKWIPGTVSSPHVRAFFIPHRFRNAPEVWLAHTSDAGIVFDRCRIAHWAQFDPLVGQGNRWAEQEAWVGERLVDFQE